MHIDKKLMHRLFALIAGAILFAWLVLDTARATALFNRIWELVAPFAAGAAIAFIFNVPMRAIEKQLEGVRKQNVKRGLAIVLTILCLVLLVMFVFELLIPQIRLTLESLAATIPAFIDRTAQNLMVLIEENPDLGIWIQDTFHLQSLNWSNIIKDILSWLANQVSTVMGGAVNVIGSVTSGIVNAVIGIVFARAAIVAGIVARLVVVIAGLVIIVARLVVVIVLGMLVLNRPAGVVDLFARQSRVTHVCYDALPVGKHMNVHIVHAIIVGVSLFGFRDVLESRVIKDLLAFGNVHTAKIDVYPTGIVALERPRINAVFAVERHWVGLVQRYEPVLKGAGHTCVGGHEVLEVANRGIGRTTSLCVQRVYLGNRLLPCPSHSFVSHRRRGGFSVGGHCRNG
jgi:hypothetical protein